MVAAGRGVAAAAMAMEVEGMEVEGRGKAVVAKEEAVEVRAWAEGVMG